METGGIRNRILVALSEGQRSRLVLALERREMHVGEIMSNESEIGDSVYFVESGLVSIQAVTARGDGIEIATVGHEGMVGAWVGLGSRQSLGRAVCIIRGVAWLLSADALLGELALHDGLTTLLGLYTRNFLAEVSQWALCGRLHSSGQQCARWLLQAHDRVGDGIRVTQAQLSTLLGLRRVTVTTAAGMLKKAGAVDYRRGLITIRDRAALERAACDCYGSVCRATALTLVSTAENAGIDRETDVLGAVG
jgi:CRP-like cAMP-binding protein